MKFIRNSMQRWQDKIIKKKKLNYTTRLYTVILIKTVASSPSISVQTISTFCLVAAILNSGCQPTSADVGSRRQCHSAISESGWVENMGVATETALKSISVQKLFLPPVLVAAIVNFGRRPMSGHVVSAISASGVIENVGIAVGLASPSRSVQKWFLLLISTCQFSGVEPPCW